MIFQLGCVLAQIISASITPQDSPTRAGLAAPNREATHSVQVCNMNRNGKGFVTAETLHDSDTLKSTHQPCATDNEPPDAPGPHARRLQVARHCHDCAYDCGPASRDHSLALNHGRRASDNPAVKYDRERLIGNCIFSTAFSRAVQLRRVKRTCCAIIGIATTIKIIHFPRLKGAKDRYAPLPEPTRLTDVIRAIENAAFLL